MDVCVYVCMYVCMGGWKKSRWWCEGVSLGRWGVFFFKVAVPPLKKGKRKERKNKEKRKNKFQRADLIILMGWIIDSRTNTPCLLYRKIRRGRTYTNCFCQPPKKPFPVPPPPFFSPKKHERSECVKNIETPTSPPRLHADGTPERKQKHKTMHNIQHCFQSFLQSKLSPPPIPRPSQTKCKTSFLQASAKVCAKRKNSYRRERGEKSKKTKGSVGGKETKNKKKKKIRDRNRSDRPRCGRCNWPNPDTSAP